MKSSEADTVKRFTVVPFRLSCVRVPVCLGHLGRPWSEMSIEFWGHVSCSWGRFQPCPIWNVMKRGLQRHFKDYMIIPSMVRFFLGIAIHSSSFFQRFLPLHYLFTNSTACEFMASTSCSRDWPKDLLRQKAQVSVFSIISMFIYIVVISSFYCVGGQNYSDR